VISSPEVVFAAGVTFVPCGGASGASMSAMVA
jgi:hypothetical protein